MICRYFFFVYLFLIINPINSLCYQMRAYDCTKDRKKVKALLPKCYIINRIISDEERADISLLTKFAWKTFRQVVSLLLYFSNTFPAKLYVLEKSGKIVGFIALIRASYYEKNVYEICFFGVDEQINDFDVLHQTKIKEKLFAMLSFIVGKAAEESIEMVSIDLQKNASELGWATYLEHFGFTFDEHTFLKDGITGKYKVNICT